MAKKSSNLSGALGLAALAAAAAGAYYFYGKNGAAHRKQLKGWAVKARGEVMERMENLKDVSRSGYIKTVDQVMKKYRTLKNVTPAELAALGRELKSHWSAIEKQLMQAGKQKGRK